MLQTVATIASLLMLSLGLTVIAASLIDEWETVRGALGLGRSADLVPLPRARAIKPARRARVIRFAATGARRAA